MKKILVVGPLLSASGYGEMARFALRALKEHQDKFDIYVHLINWGQTGYLFEDNEEFEWIKHLRLKSEHYFLQKGLFDISLQITIPNEWKKLAPINIGYTAGIETNVVSPAWFEPCSIMDKIIVISEHAKNSLVSSIFADQNKNTYTIKTPIDVVHFPFPSKQVSALDEWMQMLEVKEKKPSKSLELSCDFNFLCVNQWGPRKNIEQLVSDFVEEFRNEEIGLVLKTNTANDSIIDKFSVENRLANLLEGLGNRKCKITLIHGRLTDDEMYNLYRNPKIKCFVTSTHGEGFGIPIFEAMAAELPIIATDWSGHLDFLSMPNEQGKEKKMFAKVAYELKPIEQQHVWPGVMEAGSAWAFPLRNSLRSRMRETHKEYGRFKSWANKLAVYNKEKFSKDKIVDKFISNFSPFIEEIKQEDELIVL